MRVLDVQIEGLVNVPITVWVIGRPNMEGAPSSKVNSVVAGCVLENGGVWIIVIVREVIEFIWC